MGKILSAVNLGTIIPKPTLDRKIKEAYNKGYEDGRGKRCWLCRLFNRGKR
jgi:hypothetical protein